MPRVMETANSNFYSDITWPLPRLPSGQERPGMFFLFLMIFKKNLKKEKNWQNYCRCLVAGYIQKKNVDTLTIISATFGFGNFPDNFVCN